MWAANAVANGWMCAGFGKAVGRREITQPKRNSAFWNDPIKRVADGLMGSAALRRCRRRKPESCGFLALLGLARLMWVQSRCHALNAAGYLINGASTLV